MLLLILILCNSAPPASISGWTLLTNNGVVPQIYIYYKTAGASESSVAITSASTTSVNVMLAYRGTSGFDVTGAFANNQVTTSLATTSLTTTQASDYIISIYGSNASSSNTWTAPASTTARVTSNSGTSKRGLLIVDELQTSAGATTARTATLSLANQITSVGLSIKESATTTVNSNFFLLML